MNKYVRNNFFYSLLYPCLSILSCCLYFNSVHSSYSLPYTKGCFFCMTIYCFIESIKLNKAYIIKNGHFISKQFFRTSKINLNKLTDFFIEKKDFQTFYIFCFSKKKYKIYQDKKTKVLIDYFLENYFEEFYKRKVYQFELSEYKKSNKFFISLFLCIFSGFLLLLAGIIAIYKMLVLGGTDLIVIFFLTIMFFQEWGISLKQLLNSRIYFSKEGLHLKKYIIPYHEIKKIIEFEKKILSPRCPIYIKSLRVITEVEEIVIEDILTSNIVLYKYVREKINQKERIIISRENEVEFC